MLFSYLFTGVLANKESLTMDMVLGHLVDFSETNSITEQILREADLNDIEKKIC